MAADHGKLETLLLMENQTLTLNPHRFCRVHRPSPRQPHRPFNSDGVLACVAARGDVRALNKCCAYRAGSLILYITGRSIEALESLKEHVVCDLKLAGDMCRYAL